MGILNFFLCTYILAKVKELSFDFENFEGVDLMSKFCKWLVQITESSMNGEH